MTGSRRIIIGSGQDVDVRIHEPEIQDRHAIIHLDDDGTWYLSDLAGNGTTIVNGQVAGFKELNTGDLIQIGNTSLMWPDQIVAKPAPAMPISQYRHAAAPKNAQPARRNERSANAPERPISIGSDPSADIRIVNPGIEARHATLILRNGQWTLSDNSCSNATWVNGQRAGHEPLSDGDIVTLGSYSIRWPFYPQPDAQQNAATKPQTPVPPCKLGPRLRFTDVSIANFEKSKKTPIQLGGVNLEFSPGTVNAIIGPSAIGKSTLIRALTGEAQIVSGEIKMNSFSLSTDGTFPPQILSYVPQRDNLLETLTVWEYLVYTSTVRNLAKNLAQEHEVIVAEVIDSLRLSDVADKPICKLSGGQRKRVSVASELVTEPQLLVLDEPSSGLDEGLDRLLVSLLKEIARRNNMVVLFVTHAVLNLDLADSVTLIGAPHRLQPNAPRSTITFSGKPADILKKLGCHSYADLFDSVRVSSNSQPATTNNRYKRRKRRHLPTQPKVQTLVVRRLRERGHLRLEPQHKQITPAHTLSRHSDSAKPLAILKSTFGFTSVAIACAIMLTYVGIGFGGQLETATTPPNPKFITLLQFLVTVIGFLVMRKPMVSFTDSWTFMKRELVWGINPTRSLLAQFLVDSPWIIAFPAIAVTATQTLEETLFNAPPAPVDKIVWLSLYAAAFAFSCYSIGMLISVTFAEKDRVLTYIVVAMIGLTITTGVIVPLSEGSWITKLMWLSPARQFISGAASILNHEALIGFVFDPAFTSSTHTAYLKLLALLAIGSVAIGVSILKVNHTVNKY